VSGPRLPRLLVAARAPLLVGRVSNALQHAPLPYVVTLRSVGDDDAVAQRWERRVVAYSVFEAVSQAMLEVTGAMPADVSAQAKLAVEAIAPDVEAFFRLAAQKVAAK
jgi:hypothetical protein